MSFRNYYDTSSYGRNRADSGRVSSTSDRPTTVTAKYIAPTYKTSSIPVLRRDTSATRDETPIASIASRYGNYKTTKEEKPKYGDRKDSVYNRLTIPSLAHSKSREPSPVSSSSKYSTSRSPRALSPDRRTLKTPTLTKSISRDTSPKDKEKDIPSKTDKSSGYSSGYSTYKIFPRSTTYVRPLSRTETKPEITLSRYGVTNRLSSSYLRGNSIERTPTSSTSPNNMIASDSKPNAEDLTIKSDIPEENCNGNIEIHSDDVQNGEEIEEKFETITVITRHTSPTPPGSSAYVRTRRADMAKTVEKSVTRSNKRPPMADKYIQSERFDETRNSRFGNTTRGSVSSWSSYSPSSSKYCGYAGRYSTQYANIRDQSLCSNSVSDKSESSNSSISTNVTNKETPNIDSETESRLADTKKVSNVNLDSDKKSEVLRVNKENEEDTSEIVINVNLKLKKTKTPHSVNCAEMVSPEVTITNSQLPPQAPKAEIPTKTKKVKIKKTSSDSSNEPKKRIIKKRRGSSSSADSDLTTDRTSSEKSSPVKEIPKRTTPSLSRQSSPLNNDVRHISESSTNASNKIRHSIKSQTSRESNSPDSIVTTSTQTSCSDDDVGSKSKSSRSNDLSRTSADDLSISFDKSAKYSPPPAQKVDQTTDEAKSFLIRALAPATNFFKKKQYDNSENGNWLDSTSESTSKDAPNISTESDLTNKNKKVTIESDHENKITIKPIRHIESGERAWWLDSDQNEGKVTQSNSSDKNIHLRKIKHVESGERAWWLDSGNESKGETHPSENISSEPLNGGGLKIKLIKQDSDEKPWWLDSSAKVPEGIERVSPARKTSSESEKSEKFDFYKIRHIDSGEKDWWLTSNSENVTSSNSKEKINESLNISKSTSGSNHSFPLKRIRHIDSGERPWWLSSSNNVPEGIEKLPTPPQLESDSSVSDEIQVFVGPNNQIPPFPLTLPDDEPLGDRRSPEGLETPREDESYRQRRSPYENTNYHSGLPQPGFQKSKKFVSRYTDIDDIFGTSGQMYSPFMDSILARRTGQVQIDSDFSDCEEIDPTQVRIHDSTPQHPVIKKLRCRSEIIDCRDEDQLDDVALQVYKNNDYGVYLDLDATVGEQQEELEGLRDQRRNAIVLRTQLSVRVHSIIERLREAEGRDLRKALFSLKQVLQRDKDLVHEFVENDGLDCLMSVGSSDPNYLEYVLRALGQIVLYVDGMHGVMHHKTCIQWLYTLTTNPFRHIVKNCLKLLMVFVEYNDMNCTLLINAVHSVDATDGRQPWQNIMRILKDFDASDTELLIYATTLINRCLNNAVDRDVYYDQVDALEDQGFDDIIKLYMSKQGTDLDLLRQFQIYEAVLSYEDGDETGTALKQLDDSVISLIRRRSSLGSNQIQRRKSKKQMLKDDEDSAMTKAQSDNNLSNGISLNHKDQFINSLKDNRENQEKEKALRRRRERFARQSHHIIQQQELYNNTNGFKLANGSADSSFDLHDTYNSNDITSNNNVNIVNNSYNSNGVQITNGLSISKNRNNSTNFTYNTNGGYSANANISSNSIHVENAANNNNISNNGKPHDLDNEVSSVNRTMRNLNIADALVHGTQRYTAGLKQRIHNGTLGHSLNAKDALMVIRKKNLEPNNECNDLNDKGMRITNASEETPTRVAEMTGLLLKAKEGLAKSQSKDAIKSPPITPKVQISENELQWEELRKGLNRAYHICDLDFSDLMRDDEDDVSNASKMGNGVPPPPLPPPPLGMFNSMNSMAPPPPPGGCIPPPKPIILNSSANSNSSTSYDDASIKKNKKTVKLFWKEVAEAPLPPSLRQKVGSIWDDLPSVNVDTKMLEHLFESRSNDLLIKKLQEPKKTFILDTKRSNAINIGMKKLPTPQAIKTAIMKMDATVMGREGIEKLLTMLPTEEEKIKIQEAQYANPDLPLGNAEQFLLALASITELSSRLKLWLFKLDFENAEKEIAEPLMDLKQGIELLKVNLTFKAILSTLRSVGSFLNGTQVKGFRLEYLSKVMEVKDTVHKHPLLYHICEMIIQKFPESSDFFSEVGPVIRASKVDFDALKQNLAKLEADCKSSWDHLKRVAKHDGPMIVKTRINEFLSDAAERIILLGIIEKRVLNRFSQFLLYIGVPLSEVANTKPSAFLKILSEFALEYMTSRERVLQQLEKKANHRERNKTRGKLIIDSGNYSNKNGDIAADAALRELLMTDGEDSSAMGRKKIPNKSTTKSDLQTPDEIFESLVKSSMISRRKPRERKRARLLDKLTGVDRTIDTN